MYQEFKLTEVKDASIMGYHWEAEEPCCVVLMLHGIGEYAGKFDRMAELWKEAHISCIGMDLRGHGCSSGKRGHAFPRQAILSDVDCLIRYASTIYPRLPVILYGHSLGGNVALDYRRRGLLAQALIGYIASSPWLLLSRKVHKRVYYFVKAMAKINPTYQMSAQIDSNLLGNEEVMKQTKHKGLFHNMITAATALETYEIGLSLIKEREALGKKKKPEKNSGLNGNHGDHGNIAVQNAVPVLIMHGDADEICSIEGSRRFAAKEGSVCTSLEWPLYFHELHNGNDHENGEAVIHAMIDWVKGLLL